MQDGDLINVSVVKSPTVLVSGEVKNPGAFELKEGDSLPQLITRAGGPTLEAALTRVIVERNGEKIIKDVLPSLNNGVGMDFPLLEGDFVVVQKNTARVLVIPAVIKPGYYPIPENGTLTVGGSDSGGWPQGSRQDQRNRYHEANQGRRAAGALQISQSLLARKYPGRSAPRREAIMAASGTPFSTRRSLNRPTNAFICAPPVTAARPR